MSIVAPADFIGDVNIPNSGDTYVGTKANVQFFIDKYEPIFLESLLGYDLYQLYLAGIVPVPVDPATDPVTYEAIPAKWLAIQALAKPLLLNFIYYYFKEDEFTYSSGVGVVKTKGENAINASPGRKMVSRWNEMVAGVFKAVQYWDSETYGDYYIDFASFGFSWSSFNPLSYFVYGRFYNILPIIFFTNNSFQL